MVRRQVQLKVVLDRIGEAFVRLLAIGRHDGDVSGLCETGNVMACGAGGEVIERQSS
jgi:hypothetical protein